MYCWDIEYSKYIALLIVTNAHHYSSYIPGWDCHGLPIENKALEELGVSHVRPAF